MWGPVSLVLHVRLLVACWLVPVRMPSVELVEQEELLLEESSGTPATITASYLRAALLPRSPRSLPMNQIQLL
ncbi:hypothetical protein BDY21DRAFT_344874 [Lineolata rhizophorae]|uniref:Secreted protein n=1 Tax=Lineolata rhizophorae TaxID=578093 RepID=A0A6A6NZG9_9PEZI|nr:hypothetical protein BDY21DRAFT_344874 [Lineolata rhizophorae]